MNIGPCPCPELEVCPEMETCSTPPVLFVVGETPLLVFIYGFLLGMLSIIVLLLLWEKAAR